jgi:hypothetical protein
MNGLFWVRNFSFSSRVTRRHSIGWDTVGQRVKDDILQALTGDKQFIASENECEQCFHLCRILKGDSQVLRMARPGQATRLLIPVPLCFSEIPNSDHNNSDAKEVQAELDECAGSFMI